MPTDFTNAFDIAQPLTNVAEFDRVFVHVPKSGGYSIKHVLNTTPGLRTIFFGHPTHAHPDLTMIRRYVGASHWHRLFKFAIVRNPWDRAVSCYHWLRDNPGMMECQAARTLEFKEWILQQTTNSYFCMTWEQKAFTNMNGLEINKVIRFEALEEGLKDILWLPSIPIHNSTKHGHYSEYYDSKAKDKIYELYRDDIKEFGYSFDKEA